MVRTALWLVMACGCGARSELAVPVAITVGATDVPAYAITVDEKNVYWTQGYWSAGSAPTHPLALQCEKANCQKPSRS